MPGDLRWKRNIWTRTFETPYTWRIYSPWLLYCQTKLQQRDRILHSHCSVFVQKRRFKSPLFWTRSHYSAQKRTKTEVYENALQSGYLQKRTFSSDAVDQFERTKMDICLDHSIAKGLKPQKQAFFLRCCKQRERTKTDTFIWIFGTKTEQCERFTDIYKNGVVRKRSSVNSAGESTPVALIVIPFYKVLEKSH